MLRKSGLAAKVLTVLIVTVCLIPAATPTSAADWAALFEKIKSKYAKFEKEIKDMTILQEIKTVTPDRELKSESKMLKKNKMFRTEITMEVPEMPKEMGPMSSIVIYDGKDTWMISSMMGKQKLIGDEEKQYQIGSDWWGFLSEKAEITGSEKIDSYDCYVVEADEQGDYPYSRIWIDKNSLVLIKAEREGPNDKKIQMVFSDFKKVKDTWDVPYKTEMLMDGKLMSVVLVKSIEINKNLSDDLFDPEKVEVKGTSMQDIMKMMKEKDD